MSPPNPYLEAFITLVPSCSWETELGSFLQIFKQERCDRIVMVGRDRQPLGFLSLKHLVPYLIADKAEQGMTTEDVANLWSSREVMSEWLEPLDIYPANLSLPEFLTVWSPPALDRSAIAHHPEQSSSAFAPYSVERNIPVALVNEQGAFLGLLDWYQISQFLVTHADVFPQSESPAKPNDFDENLAGSSEEDASVADSVSVESFAPLLTPLVQLLERLPIPLMLQTSQGQVVTHNALWCDRMAELEDLEWIQREAAALLEMQPQQQFSSDSPDADGYDVQAVEGQILGAVCAIADAPHAPARSQRPDTSSEPSSVDSTDRDAKTSPAQFCHLSDRADTCICASAVKGGQDQVWQFVKIPLGSLLPTLQIDLAEQWLHQKGALQDSSLSSFQLAALGNNEEPAVAVGLSADRETISLNDGEALWLVLAQDVTEQHQAMKELAAKNADLMQLNRLKDEFLACVTHELKTPLTAVLGLSSLLKDCVLGDLNERQARYVNLIHQSGRTLMSVVNDILDLTRMETGQIELAPQLVKIAKVCDRALEQAQQLQELKAKPERTAAYESEDETDLAAEVSFAIEIEPGLETLVADELRLRQILEHLVANALKFTHPGDAAGLRVGRWEGWIAFTVWDTGIGIPANKQHLIFQKFQQLENPLTRQFEGTGLGLVLAQRLARLHGGDITFISREGEGSQFTLLLPPSPPHGGSNAAEDPLPPAQQLLKNHLILVVESVPRFIEDLNTRLTELGYRVAIARSGTEALEKARRLQPCAIFLNPVLPLLGGWDVLTLLKADGATQHIPVVVTATQAERDIAHQNRAEGFLNLPVEESHLLQVLNYLLIEPLQTSALETTVQSNLTILLLNLNSDVTGSNAPGSDENSNLSRLLHFCQYRVLEADDLEQAAMLSRVWQFDVILLDGLPTEPVAYLKVLSSYRSLAALPIVTLDAEIATAASSLEKLSVFPCFSKGAGLEPAALFKAIQVAAGVGWKPTVLTVDLSLLPDLVDPSTAQQLPNHQFGAWPQAFAHYLQTAGFRGLTAHSWAEILQQIHYGSIDLLLICWMQSQLPAASLRALTVLQQLPQKPPILVLDRRHEANKQMATQAATTVQANESRHAKGPISSEDLVTSLADCILPASADMEMVLAQIRAVLQIQDCPTDEI